VTRRTETGQSVGDDERLSLLEAIRLFTYNGAYASFDEAIKGSIEVGKLADLVVLNDAILDVPEDQISEMKVDLTLINGEVVFERGGITSYAN
jgi:predicted amidohydrolase YtcJ